MPRPLRPLEEVRTDWRERFGPPPALRSAELLDLMLAWRVQAAEEGGLGDATRKALLGAKPMVADGLEEGTRRWCQSNDNLSPAGEARAGGMVLSQRASSTRQMRPIVGP